MHRHRSQESFPLFRALPYEPSLDYQETAVRYALFIARQLQIEESWSPGSRWFVEQALPALNSGTHKDQETVAMWLILDAMRNIKPRWWSFANAFVIGASLKTKRCQPREEPKTSLQRPS